MSTPSEPAGPLPEPTSRVLVRLMAAASLLRIGETEAGLRALRSVVAVWPEHPLPRYRLAVVLAGSGRGQEALEALTGAVAAGLAAADDLDTEPAFDRLRRDPLFMAARSGTRRNRATAGPADPGAVTGTGSGPVPAAGPGAATGPGAEAGAGPDVDPGTGRDGRRASGSGRGPGS